MYNIPEMTWVPITSTLKTSKGGRCNLLYVKHEILLLPKSIFIITDGLDAPLCPL